MTHAAAAHGGPAGAIMSKLPSPAPTKKRCAASIAAGGVAAGTAMLAAYLVGRR